jgi:hypothetical protein
MKPAAIGLRLEILHPDNPGPERRDRTTSQTIQSGATGRVGGGLTSEAPMITPATAAARLQGRASPFSR